MALGVRDLVDTLISGAGITLRLIRIHRYFMTNPAGRRRSCCPRTAIASLASRGKMYGNSDNSKFLPYPLTAVSFYD